MRWKVCFDVADAGFRELVAPTGSRCTVRRHLYRMPRIAACASWRHRGILSSHVSSQHVLESSFIGMVVLDWPPFCRNNSSVVFNSF